jgi:hypothetical protein
MLSVSKQTIKQKLSHPKPVWLQNTYKLPNNKKRGPDLGYFGLFLTLGLCHTQWMPMLGYSGVIHLDHFIQNAAKKYLFT